MGTEQDMQARFGNLCTTGAEWAERLFPRPVPVGQGDVHDLLTGPYLEHSGYSSESNMDHFPVNPVKLVGEEDAYVMEPRPGKLFVHPKSQSLPFIGGEFARS